MKKLITILVILFPLVGFSCGVFGKSGSYIVINKVNSVYVFGKKSFTVATYYSGVTFNYETTEKRNSEFDRLMTMINKCKFK